MNEFCIKAIEWFAGITGSVIVVFITQLVNHYYFAPRKELAEIIRRLRYNARYYANIVGNPGPENINSDAGSDLRSMAMELKAYIDERPRCSYRKLKSEDLESIANRLVLLSNTVTKKTAIEVNVEQLDIVIESLKEGRSFKGFSLMYDK